MSLFESLRTLDIIMAILGDQRVIRQSDLAELERFAKARDAWALLEGYRNLVSDAAAQRIVVDLRVNRVVYMSLEGIVVTADAKRDITVTGCALDVHDPRHAAIAVLADHMGGGTPRMAATMPADPREVGKELLLAHLGQEGALRCIGRYCPKAPEWSLEQQRLNIQVAQAVAERERQSPPTRRQRWRSLFSR